jgi:hypothetical protein
LTLGCRYDAFLGAPPPPPFPQLLVCCPGDPFVHNARFLDDLDILAKLSAAAAKDANHADQTTTDANSAGASVTLPLYTPLGLHRGSDHPVSTDLPSWARPEVHCDLSGAPQHRQLLPIGAVWRELFGTSRPLPLWVGHTPGAIFAVSRDAALRSRPPHEPTPSASAFYERALSCCGLDDTADAVAARALERLWRHVFMPDCAE